MKLFGLGFVSGGLALAVYTWRHSDMLFRGTMSAVIAGVGIILMLLGDDWAQGFARPEATSMAKTR